MEDQALSFGLSNDSRSYQSMLKSHFELCIDFEDIDGDEELKTAYPCPICADEFDLLELWCHIDLEHPIEAKSGTCPVCSMWVGMNMIEHMTTQHGNMFKNQHKSRRHKVESYPTLSLSKKDPQGEHWQSFSAGSSPVVSTSKTARDPFLSFLYGAATVAEPGNVQPDSSCEESIEEIQSDVSDDCVLKRDAQPSLSNNDQIENGRRCEFVQGLLMSAILDPDL